MEIKLIKEINSAYSPVEQVLTNRGIDIEDVPFFIDTPEDVIEDFNKLDNIEEAAKIFLSHYEKKNRILIQVDCDVDGYTSAALLYNYLKENYLGIDIDYQVHDDKTHGLEITQDILDKKYQLIFIPDAGSNQYEEHSILKNLEIDAIILDHHECEEYSQDVIVVNNQLSKNYKNKALSGVGVVWQFCRCLDSISPYTQVTFAKDYLDLVSLGLIADMMDMRSLETKKLIELGLDKMQSSSNTNNAFLKSLIAKQSYSLGSTLTPIGLAFYIAPLINAVVRVGTHEERLVSFEAFLIDRGNKEIASTKRGHKGETETVIEQATRMLTNVKNRQKKKRDDAFLVFEKKINEEYLKNNSIIFINTNNTLDTELNGLVANQIMNKYKRPTLILGLRTTTKDDGSEVKVYSGSARGFESSVLSDFRQFILDSGFANYAEGRFGL
jgi:single-stranded-DNA-specific exonuclease